MEMKSLRRSSQTISWLGCGCWLKSIKTEFTKLMRDDFDVDCWLGNEFVMGEGYVMAGRHGLISW